MGHLAGGHKSRKIVLPFILLFLSTNTASFSQNFWRQTSGPFGGDVRAIAVNANGEVFAGHDGGGIYYLSANGGNWIAVNTGLTNGVVNALALNASGHLFAGTLAGVFRSTDRGNAWTPINAGLINDKVRALAVNSKDDIFAGTEGGVFRLPKDSTKWEPLNLGVPDNFVQAITIFKIRAAEDIWIGTRGAGILRSSDNGNTWNAINSGLPANPYPTIRSLAADANGSILAGTNSGVFRYTNLAGWTNIGLTNFSIPALHVHSPGVIFAGTEGGGIYRSTNDGATWLTANADLSISVVQAFGRNSSGHIFAGTTGGVFRSTNTGDSWAEESADMITSKVSALVIKSTGNIFAGTRAGRIFISTDDGANWALFNAGLPSDAVQSLQALAVSPATKDVFAGTKGAGLFRLSDGDDVWKPISGLTGKNILSLAVNAGGHIFAGGERDSLMRSTDNGNSWKSIKLPGAMIHALAINSKGHLFAGTPTGIFRSPDNGDTWTTVNNGLLLRPEIQALAINANDDIYAGALSGAVYRSTNTSNGDIWTLANSGLPSLPVNVLAANAAGHLFAGTAGDGIYRTVDNGGVWSAVNAGLTAKIIESLAIKSDGFAFAGTNAGGVYRSNNSTAPPEAPSGLSATAVSNTKINLAWTDNSTIEDGFKIERKAGATGTYAEIFATAANATSYSDTGLSASTQYFYRVRAYNLSGNSAYSNEANATTLPNPIPVVSFSTDSLKFGNVLVHADFDLPVRLTNRGSADLSIRSTSRAGANASQFSIVNGGDPGVLAPNASRDILLRFSPQNRGSKLAYFVITSNAASSPDTVALLGNGVDTAFEQDSLALVALYNSTNGASWKNKTNWLTGPLATWFGVTVSNDTVTAISLNSNNLAGPLPAAIGNLTRLTSLDLRGNLLTGAMPNTIGNLSRLTYLNCSSNRLSGDVPREMANLNALRVLHLYNNRLVNLPVITMMRALDTLFIHNNLLTFEDLEPNLGTRIDSILYAPQDSVGSPSDTTLFEGAKLTWRVNVGGSSNQYQWLKNGAPIAGATASAYAINAATNNDVGAYVCRITNTVAKQLTLFSRPQRVSAVIPPRFALAPKTLNFGSVRVNTSFDQTLTLANSLDVDITIQRTSIIAPGVQHFSFVSGEGRQILPARSAKQITVRFLPRDSGAKAAALEILSNTATLDTVNLFGTGVAPALSLSRRNVDFGDVWVGANATQTITLSNSGSANLRITGINLLSAHANTFFITSGGDTATLAPAASRHLSLRFAPPNVGAKTAALVISSNATTIPDTVKLSGNGNELSVRVEDSGNPVIGTSVNLAITSPPNFTPTSLLLFYRQAGETKYDSITVASSGNNLTAKIPPAAVTLRGVEFYVRLADGQTAITFPAVNARNKPHTIRVRINEHPFPLALEPSTYKMISMPMALDATDFAHVLKEYADYDTLFWRLFRWENNRYAEYSDINAKFTPGTAFWLVTRGGDGFGITNALSTESAQPFTIILQPGWNQIANPFAFPVAKDSVKASGRFDQPVFWDGVEYQYQVAVLEPWEGYFIYNLENRPITLTIPPVAAATSSINKTQGQSLAAHEYVLQLAAQFIGAKFVDTQNFIGLSNGARLGRDEFDFAEAPAIGDYIQLSIVENNARFAGNFKPASSDGQQWDVELRAHIRANVAKKLQITLQEMGQLPDGFQRFILDKDYGAILPVSNETFRIELNDAFPVRRLKIIVGTTAYAESNNDGIPLAPLAYALEQNYPNPFLLGAEFSSGNLQTTIRYQLSKRAPATLEIRNLLGQKVRTLVDGVQSTGLHTAIWNGLDEAGRAVTGGIYFYTLKTEEFIATRKLVLTR
jgi:ligand-binding sensor domain-containing protein